MDALKVVKCPEGGFIVIEENIVRGPGFSNLPAFACTDMGELLDFIEEKMKERSVER